jgi:hypothetical protein
MRAMKTRKPSKDERRSRRKTSDAPRAREGISMRVLGGGTMDDDLFEQVLAAARMIDPMGPWPDVAPLVLPVLKRAHHPYPPEAAPMYIHVQPGLWTGFGIDLGPAFSHISARMAEQWGIDHATLLTTALDNLRRLVVDEPPIIQRFVHDDVELVSINGQGWGSSLILLPDVLRLYLGAGAKTLLAPIRNTLIALPDDVDTDLAIGVWNALADGAHDELDIEPLRWTGSAVVALADQAIGLVN